MAIYIEITKCSENDSLVEYRFVNGTTCGLVIWDKEKVQLELEEINEPEYKDWCLDRVGYMIKKCYKNNEYPENIDFIS